MYLRLSTVMGRMGCWVFAEFEAIHTGLNSEEFVSHFYGKRSVGFRMRQRAAANSSGAIP
jgi:hypothetical protein